MQLTQRGINLIKSFEGCKLKAYKDVKGIPTIGWGATYYPNGSRVKMGDVITQEQADALLERIVSKFVTEVASVVTAKLNDNQFSALVSFAYNVGTDIDQDNIPEGLGDSRLLKKVNANPNDPTIRTEFMKWVYSGGKKYIGLVRRRAAEADLYFSI